MNIFKIILDFIKMKLRNIGLNQLDKLKIPRIFVMIAIVIGMLGITFVKEAVDKYNFNPELFKGVWQEEVVGDERLICEFDVLTYNSIHPVKPSIRTLVDTSKKNKFKIDGEVYEYELEGDHLKLINNQGKIKDFKRILPEVSKKDGYKEYSYDKDNVIYENVNDFLKMSFEYKYSKNNGENGWANKYSDNIEFALFIKTNGTILKNVKHKFDFMSDEMNELKTLDSAAYSQTMFTNPEENTNYSWQGVLNFKNKIWSEEEVIEYLKNQVIEVSYEINSTTYVEKINLKDYMN